MYVNTLYTVTSNMETENAPRTHCTSQKQLQTEITTKPEIFRHWPSTHFRFLFCDNTLCCLNDNDSSFTHQLSSLLHHIVPYAFLEWNNITATSHPANHITSQQQYGRHRTIGVCILTSCPVTQLVNKDLHQLVGAAPLEFRIKQTAQKNCRENRSNKNTSLFTCIACVLIFGMHSMDFEKVAWKRYAVLIVAWRKHHRKEHSADPVIKWYNPILKITQLKLPLQFISFIQESKTLTSKNIASHHLVQTNYILLYPLEDKKKIKIKSFKTNVINSFKLLFFILMPQSCCCFCHFSLVLLLSTVLHW